MRNFISVFLIIVGLFIGCSDVNNQTLLDKNDDYLVEIHVLDNGMVNFEGDVMSVDKFGNAFKNFEMTKESVVQLKIDEEATVGHVTDVQEILREKGTLRINYLTTNYR